MAFISQIIQQHPDAGYWHQQYPWFSIGQLVNAANKKDTPAFTQSARRTALFFNDIPRLHWLLYQQDIDMTALQALIDQEKLPAKTETQQEEAEISITASDAVIVNKIPDPAEEPLLLENLIIPETIAETTVAEKIMAPVVEEPIIIKEADETLMEPNEPTPPSISVNPLKETVAELLTQPLTEDYHSIQTFTNDFTAPQVIDDRFIDQTIDSETDEPEDVEPEEQEHIPLPTSMLSESLAQAADNYKNAALDQDAMVFKTAYQHTIDYFASQGIKLDSEPARDDRFGQQLKTFTSWLRQMKPLPGTPVPQADPLVESHAAHSLQKGEVVTEPMADVLLKQGKTNHALAVLEKLRLLHPQKSHYFAARIEQIKHL